MKFSEAKKEILEYIGTDPSDPDYCTVNLSDDNYVEIAQSDEFVGGSGHGWICDYIGNVEYDSSEELVDDLIEYLKELEVEIVSVNR